MEWYSNNSFPFNNAARINLEAKIQYFFYLSSLFFFIFSFPFVYWCFIEQDCCLSIFLYYLFIIILLCVFLFCIIACFSFIETYCIPCSPQIIIGIISFFYYGSYLGGTLYLKNTIFPIFFILYPLASFSSYGLPFFSFEHPFFYLFIYQLAIFTLYKIFTKRSIVIFLIYGSCGCLFFYQNQSYYWEKEISMPYNAYLHQNMYLFPEGMFDITEYSTLQNLLNLATSKGKKIIGGVTWNKYANDQIEGKNGIIKIFPCGYYSIREKNHQLPFAEKPTHLSYNKKNTQKELICSEFFLSPLWLQKKIGAEYIIASIKWTAKWYTRIYRFIMKSIYTLYEYVNLIKSIPVLIFLIPFIRYFSYLRRFKKIL